IFSSSPCPYRVGTTCSCFPDSVVKVHRAWDRINTLCVVWRLEQVDAVPGRIFDGKGTPERFIGRLARVLNTIRNKCSMSGIRVVHHPPEFNALVRRSASILLHREYSAHTSMLFELYKQHA